MKSLRFFATQTVIIYGKKEYSQANIQKNYLKNWYHNVKNNMIVKNRGIIIIPYFVRISIAICKILCVDNSKPVLLPLNITTHTTSKSKF